MDKNKKLITAGIFLGFAVLAFLFFFDSLIGGKIILGIDGSYPGRRFVADFIKDGFIGYWSPSVWLGMNGGNIGVSLWSLCMLIFSPEVALTVAYAIQMTLAMCFMYLLLDKFKLHWFPAIFAAIGYGFMPHFITLMYSGHLSVIGMLPFVPMLFYYLTCLFNKEKKGIVRNGVMILMSGVSWGLMMEDPQRGFYFSVVAVCYILFKLFENNEIRFREFYKAFTNKEFWFGIVKAALVAVVLFLTFASSLKGWLGSSVVAGDKAGAKENSSENEAQKWDFSTGWSMGPLELVDSVAFGFYGGISGDTDMPYWGSKPYAGNSESMGYLLMVFSVFAIVMGYKKESKVRFFFWVGIVTLLLSFGRFFPGTPFFWLFYKLPFMDRFRVPAKFMAVVSFALSIVSAFGLQFVFTMLKAFKQEQTEKLKATFKKVMMGMLIFLGVGVLGLFVVLAINGTIAGQIGDKAGKNLIFALSRMSVFTLLTLGGFYLFANLKSIKVGTAILIGLIMGIQVFDYWSIDAFYLNRAYISKNDALLQQDGLVKYLTADKEISRSAFSLKTVREGQMLPVPTSQLLSHYLTYIYLLNDLESIDIPAFSRIDSDYNQFFTKTLAGSGGTKVKNIDDLIDSNLRLHQLANTKYLITDGYLYIDKNPLVIVHALTNNPNLEFIGGFYGNLIYL